MPRPIPRPAPVMRATLFSSLNPPPVRSSFCPWASAKKYERALRGRGHDIDRAVVVEIDGEHLRARTRVMVNQFRHELRGTGSFPVAQGAIDVESGRAIRVRIEIALEVREKAFADDEVGNAVAVDVSRRRPVRLGKGEITGVLRREVPRDLVLDKRDDAGRVALLLEPRQPEAMRLRRCHHVVQPVPVDVIHGPPGTTAPERGPVKLPHRLPHAPRPLPPPSRSIDELQTS